MSESIHDTKILKVINANVLPIVILESKYISAKTEECFALNSTDDDNDDDVRNHETNRIELKRWHQPAAETFESQYKCRLYRLLQHNKIMTFEYTEVRCSK